MTHREELETERHTLNLQYHRLLATNSWNDFALHLVRLRELRTKINQIKDEIERLEEEEEQAA